VIRLNLILLVAVVVSAFFLVRTQYESRRLYAELEKAGTQYAKLETENERLQVEKRAQSTPLRVERLAKDKLQMRTVTPAITQYVSIGNDRAGSAMLPLKTTGDSQSNTSKVRAGGDLRGAP
jgi:cell division protein FtsL